MKNYQIKLYDKDGNEVEDKAIKRHIREKIKSLNVPQLSKQLAIQSTYYDQFVIRVRYCTCGDLFYVHQLMAFDGYCKIVTAERLNQVSEFLSDYEISK